VEKDFWSFRKWMVEDQQLAPKTVVDRLTIVKQLFKFAAKEKLILVNPVAGASVPEAPAAVQPCFLPEQVGALMAAANPFMAVVIAILVFTGMRVGELRELRWSDVLLARVRPASSSSSAVGRAARPSRGESGVFRSTLNCEKSWKSFRVPSNGW